MAGNDALAKLIFLSLHVLHFVHTKDPNPNLSSEYHVKFTPKKISLYPQQILLPTIQSNFNGALMMFCVEIGFFSIMHHFGTWNLEWFF